VPPVDVHPSGFVQPYLQRDASGALDFGAAARIGAVAERRAWRTRARVELDILPEVAPADAWVAVSPAAFATITAGQLRVPFSAHQLAPEWRRQLPLSPRILQDVGIDRDIGVVAELQWRRKGEALVEGTAAALNGEGANQLPEADGRTAVATRLLVTPLGARQSPAEGTLRERYVGVGGGWVYRRTGESLSELEVNTYGVDAQAAWRGYSGQAEWVYEDRTYADATVPVQLVRGGYLQLGAFVPVRRLERHLEVVARWGNAPELVTDGDYDVVGEVRNDLTLGLNGYAPQDPQRAHEMKVSVAWTHTFEGAGERVDASATFHF
jgi:hypothetical protein